MGRDLDRVEVPNTIIVKDSQGDVIYNIVPRSGHSGKAEVWGKENGFKAPLVQGTWKDIKKFFEV